MKALGKGSIASIVRVGLQIAWVVLWVLAGCLVLIAIGYGVILAMISNGMADPSLLQGGDGHVSIGRSGGGTFSVTYDEPGGATWPVMVPAMLIGAVAIAGSLVIVWRLRKLFDSFSSGEPFRRENAQHLRVIWIAMVVIELARYALLALTGFLLTRFGDPEVETSYTLAIDFSTWMSILVLIVLAEVFREGARLKEEQELTI
jgi:hypothetical protein